ncbi:MAG: D-glycero-beta-D-manno-heptose-7-phosphate kinase [Candidatus Margulisiibacteriota bacterium]|jgi:D-beta-D-heptose 7-phosphate kinase/D-beta-D-heptose 1-phosphate adenosyltransferase
MKHLSEQIDKLAGIKVLVIGDIMLDEHVWSNVTRISPEAPVPVADVQNVTYAPGGSANVANNIIALGGIPYLVGIIGTDLAGGKLIEILKTNKISADHLYITDKRQTTHKTRIIAHGQHVVRVDREDKEEIGPELAKQLIKKIDLIWPEVDAVLLSDYDKGVLSAEICQYVMQKGQKDKKIISVDPKGEDYNKYKGATIVTPNLSEAEQASKITLRTEKNLQKIGLKLLAVLGSQYLLVTQGAKGMTLFFPNRPALHIPTVAKEVYDVTGAGDTVVGTLTMALAAGLAVEDAAHLATYAAGIVVGKSGTATLVREELKKAITD